MSDLVAWVAAGAFTLFGLLLWLWLWVLPYWTVRRLDHINVCRSHRAYLRNPRTLPSPITVPCDICGRPARYGGDTDG
jgi:hypothetical protein